MEREVDIITINFRALWQVLWSEKWLILGITFLFTVGGVWYAFTAREEFVSEGKILPEIQSSSSSSLGGLANLVGIGGFELGMKNNTDAIRPDLYPDLIASTPFFLELMKQKVLSKSGDTLAFEEFYHEVVEDGRQAEDKNLATFVGKPHGVIVVNKLTEDRIKDLRERITGSIDKKSGVIAISVKMPDPVVAADVAKYAMDYLTQYVTDYRTEKNKQEVDFLGRKVAAARGEFYKDQARKASYSDQFSAPSIRLQSADVQRERLESDYKMSSNVYNELLKKYEESKIKLQEATPVFKVLEPPVVPNIRNEPKRILIALAAIVVGLFFVLVPIVLIEKNRRIIFAAKEKNI
ncbi:Wzz/FepE/Etk N-terminal domain-containing protein [Jiulongibacter sediminis]|uniref:Wzz/FepE/Etk N-terminal domain-containing protein n=1 Tax=Jiulongibacter sediminis TaxID=1605367 RepID=UPI0026ECC84E|nr:Wzz/FepE/Etk N-terminal domain-containing protein [Jiulongibacter sediminis]